MTTHYEVFEDMQQRFRWRKIRKGLITADSGFSYSRKSDAVRAARRDALTPVDAEIRVSSEGPANLNLRIV